MKTSFSFQKLDSACCVAALLIASASAVQATPAAPAALSITADGAAILMGVAEAAPTQTLLQQAADRDALKKRLRWLIDRNMRAFGDMSRWEEGAHIVRIVFDVDASGKAANVRVGKRSGKPTADRAASRMVTGFTLLPGGERKRVCVLLQYGRARQDSQDAVYKQQLNDETALAIADLKAGREGPTYDRRGRVIA